MTAHSDLDSAVSSYSRGAFEYLTEALRYRRSPIAMTNRALEHAREQSEESDAMPRSLSNQEIIGEAPAMQEVFRAIGRLSQSNISVLINGESGTGKELVARALHQHSPAQRKDLRAPERGGDTEGANRVGTVRAREGRVHRSDVAAHRALRAGRWRHPVSGRDRRHAGRDTQTRLLRVLSDGEFYRVGGHTSIKVDVRIIAATHQDLEKLVELHEFREDLFHRLNVIRIHIPRLSDRREDIPKLASHFLHTAAKELDVEVKTLRPEQRNTSPD